jgi:CIC family chloride channel protein
MSDQAETLGVDGLNPLSAPQPATQTPISKEARFRTGIVSLLAALIGILAGIIAYLLYNLIGLFTNIFF